MAGDDICGLPPSSAHLALNFTPAVGDSLAAGDLPAVGYTPAAASQQAPRPFDESSYSEAICLPRGTAGPGPTWRFALRRPDELTPLQYAAFALPAALLGTFAAQALLRSSEEQGIGEAQASEYLRLFPFTMGGRETVLSTAYPRGGLVQLNDRNSKIGELSRYIDRLTAQFKETAEFRYADAIARVWRAELLLEEGITGDTWVRATDDLKAAAKRLDRVITFMHEIEGEKVFMARFYLQKAKVLARLVQLTEGVIGSDGRVHSAPDEAVSHNLAVVSALRKAAFHSESEHRGDIFPFRAAALEALAAALPNGKALRLLPEVVDGVVAVSDGFDLKKPAFDALGRVIAQLGPGLSGDGYRTDASEEEWRSFRAAAGLFPAAGDLAADAFFPKPERESAARALLGRAKMFLGLSLPEGAEVRAVAIEAKGLATGVVGRMMSQGLINDSNLVHELLLVQGNIPLSGGEEVRMSLALAKAAEAGAAATKAPLIAAQLQLEAGKLLLRAARGLPSLAGDQARAALESSAEPTSLHELAAQTAIGATHRYLAAWEAIRNTEYPVRLEDNIFGGISDAFIQAARSYAADGKYAHALDAASEAIEAVRHVGNVNALTAAGEEVLTLLAEPGEIAPEIRAGARDLAFRALKAAQEPRVTREGAPDSVLGIKALAERLGPRVEEQPIPRDRQPGTADELRQWLAARAVEKEGDERLGPTDFLEAMKIGLTPFAANAEYACHDAAVRWLRLFKLMQEVEGASPQMLAELGTPRGLAAFIRDSSASPQRELMARFAQRAQESALDVYSIGLEARRAMEKGMWDRAAEEIGRRLAEARRKPMRAK